MKTLLIAPRPGGPATGVVPGVFPYSGLADAMRHQGEAVVQLAPEGSRAVAGFLWRHVAPFDRIAVADPHPVDAVMAAAVARFRGARLELWLSRLEPERALAEAALRPDSREARWRQGCMAFAREHAEMLVVPDRFLRERLLAGGVPPDRVEVVAPVLGPAPVASTDQRQQLRSQMGWGAKLVVMAAPGALSGPAVALIGSAMEHLAPRNDIVFCLPSGGDFRPLHEHAAARRQTNVATVPDLPPPDLAGYLMAADLHVVSMDERLLGLAFPACAVFVAHLGRPLLYLGPESSPIADLGPRYRVAPGDVNGAIHAIVKAARALSGRWSMHEENDARRIGQILALMTHLGGSVMDEVEIPRQ